MSLDDDLIVESCSFIADEISLGDESTGLEQIWYCESRGLQSSEDVSRK